MREPRSNWQKWEQEKQHEVQRAANASGFGSHFATNDDFYFIVSYNVKVNIYKYSIIYGGS